jgi:hypothetical protein
MGSNPNRITSMFVDFLTMYPDARRRVARMLGEIEADETSASPSGTSRDGIRG